jgi:hypothetical protein
MGFRNPYNPWNYGRKRYPMPTYPNGPRPTLGY